MRARVCEENYVSGAASTAERLAAYLFLCHSEHCINVISRTPDSGNTRSIVSELVLEAVFQLAENSGIRQLLSDL
jgi:hypothetical protein